MTNESLAAMLRGFAIAHPEASDLLVMAAERLEALGGSGGLTKSAPMTGAERMRRSRMLRSAQQNVTESSQIVTNRHENVTLVTASATERGGGGGESLPLILDSSAESSIRPQPTVSISPESVARVAQQNVTNVTTSATLASGWSAAFRAFFDAYPSGSRSRSSWLIWRELKLDGIAPQVMAGLHAWLACERWSNPKFVLGMAEWLRERKWEDLPMAAAPKLLPGARIETTHAPAASRGAKEMKL